VSKRKKTTPAPGSSHAEARRIADRNIRAGHHYQDDVACIACGTDSTVGCIVALGGGDA
jgi:hypothetical protein